MLPPAAPHTHDVRTIVAAVAGGELAGELRLAVHRQRVGLVVLAVRPLERAVEHVIGAELHEMGAGCVARLAEPAHRVGVVTEGPCGIALAGVDSGPRGGVDDDLGSVRSERC